MTRLRHLVDQIATVGSDGPLPFVALEHLESGTGGFAADAVIEDKESDPAGMVQFSSGDVMFGKLRPYLRKSWLADRSGLCSSELIVMRPRPGKADSRWLAYAVQTQPFVDWAVASSEGVKMPRTSWEKLGLYELHPPPVVGQRAIADYLDAEAARIDKMIDALGRRANLLDMRKRAAVSTALGSVATATVAVRRVVDLVTSGPRGWSDLVVDSGTRLFLRIANVPRDSISLRLADVAYIEPPLAAEADRCRVRPGDVLTTITAAIGQVAVVPAGLGEAYVSQHLALIRPAPSRVVPEWLALALWTDDAQRQLDAARYGGTKQQLALDDVRDIRIPWAPLSQQRNAVGPVLRDLETLTEAWIRTRREMDLLQVRREAVVTAAVTGQIEIPGVAA